MFRSQGFAGERLHIIPEPLREQLRQGSALSSFMVTDCGMFPQAAGHRRERPKGVEQIIVMVCSSGLGWVQEGQQRWAVSAGDVVVIAPSTPHSYGADATAPWSLHWFHAIGTEVELLASAARASGRGPVVHIGEVFSLTTLIDAVLDVLAIDDSEASLLAASGAARYVVARVPLARRQGLDSGDPARLAVEYLNDRPRTHVSVGELAHIVCISPSHLEAEFRKLTGQSVVQYQIRRRMSEAATLLDGTDLSIAEIANRLGFVDPFYFSRQFRSVRGESPRAYRSRPKG